MQDIQDRYANLNDLEIDALHELMNKVSDWAVLIKDFYPRTYERLLRIKPKIRDRYAQLKYPELYQLLKKHYQDPNFGKDKVDDDMGFGPWGLYIDKFAEYFVRSEEYLDRHFEHASPFEARFAHSIFFPPEEKLI